MITDAASYDEVKDIAMHLPLEYRSRLAARLIESLDEKDEVSAEWLGELRRRTKRIDDGTANMIPNEEVWKQVNERFGTHL
jgi:putative addiction module component (TIGR02574 family)